MLKKLSRFSILMLSLALLAGCNTSEITPVSAETFNTEQKTPENSEASKLAAGESVELSVEVDGQMEVAEHRATINEAGMVTLPLVGDVKVGNKSLSDARAEIASAYSSYYVNTPVIMFSRILEDEEVGEWGFVTVTGRVMQPGRVKVPSPVGIKLTAVIQESGGFAASAKRSAVRITRSGGDRRRIRLDVDYDAIGQEGNAAADVDLHDGDIVYVPERIF